MDKNNVMEYGFIAMTMIVLLMIVDETKIRTLNIQWKKKQRERHDDILGFWKINYTMSLHRDNTHFLHSLCPVFLRYI